MGEEPESDSESGAGDDRADDAATRPRRARARVVVATLAPRLRPPLARPTEHPMTGPLTPSLTDVRRMVGQGDIVPIYREVRADLETPVSAYLKIARGPYSFLLESVEGGERQGRYSFI